MAHRNSLTPQAASTPKGTPRITPQIKNRAPWVSRLVFSLSAALRGYPGDAELYSPWALTFAWMTSSFRLAVTSLDDVSGTKNQDNLQSSPETEHPIRCCYKKMDTRLVKTDAMATFSIVILCSILKTCLSDRTEIEWRHNENRFVLEL